MLGNTSVVKGHLEKERVPLAIAGVTQALVLRKMGLVLATALLSLIVVQAVCIATLAGRAPRRFYVPESTLLTPMTIVEESRDG